MYTYCGCCLPAMEITSIGHGLACSRMFLVGPLFNFIHVLSSQALFLTSSIPRSFQCAG